jgi:hypothetical protein
LLKQPKKFQRYKIFPSLRFKALGNSGFAFCGILNVGMTKKKDGSDESDPYL